MASLLILVTSSSPTVPYSFVENNTHLLRVSIGAGWSHSLQNSRVRSDAVLTQLVHVIHLVVVLLKGMRYDSIVSSGKRMGEIKKKMALCQAENCCI